MQLYKCMQVLMKIMISPNRVSIAATLLNLALLNPESHNIVDQSMRKIFVLPTLISTTPEPTPDDFLIESPNIDQLKHNLADSIAIHTITTIEQYETFTTNHRKLCICSQ